MKLTQSFRWRFSNLLIYFCNFFMISLWEKVWLFNMKKPLNPVHLRMHFTKVWFKLAHWFQKRYFNFNVFSIFHSYLPLEKGTTLHLNKLESPSPKDALCKVWFKLVQWFCRRRSFIIRQCIFVISLLPPLGNKRGHSFEQT